MPIIGTTLITILRGEGTDAYGDPIDLDRVVYANVSASILETQSRATRPNEGRSDNVRSYALRVRPSVVLQRDDRVRDQADGTTYTVDEIVKPTNPVGHSITRAVLRRVT